MGKNEGESRRGISTEGGGGETWHKDFQDQSLDQSSDKIFNEGPNENLIFVQQFIEKPCNKRGGEALVRKEVTRRMGTSESHGKLNYTLSKHVNLHVKK